MDEWGRFSIPWYSDPPNISIGAIYIYWRGNINGTTEFYKKNFKFDFILVSSTTPDFVAAHQGVPILSLQADMNNRCVLVPFAQILS